MRAVDHVVERRTVRFGVDLLDRPSQRLAAREPAVGLDGEGHHDRQPGCARRAHHSDRLVGVGERHGRDEIGGSVRERLELRRVVPLRLVACHQGRGRIGIRARSDGRLQQYRPLRRGRACAQLVDERDRAAVGRREGVGVVAELGAPVGIRAPRAAAQDEAGAAGARELEEGRVVRAKRVSSGLVLEQRERRKGGQIDALVEDQRRLHPGIGQEEGALVEEL